jgi:mono/diheme cytochrome c family protein
MKKIVICFAAMCCFSLYLIAQQAQPAEVQESIARGEKLYTLYCLSCHQKSGNGVPHMNPPLIKTSYVTGDIKKLVTWVLKGSTENIPIDGKTYSNNMPAQNYLKDDQIADVLTYVRNSFGNTSSAVTPADVKEVRASLK